MFIDSISNADTLPPMKRLAKPFLRLVLIIFTLNMGMMTFSAEAFVDNANGTPHALACESGTTSDQGGACTGIVCNHLCHAAGHYLGYISTTPEMNYPESRSLVLITQAVFLPSYKADAQFRPPRLTTLS
jgi:hypothetical protein